MATLPEGGMYGQTYKDTSNIDLSLHWRREWTVSGAF